MTETGCGKTPLKGTKMYSFNSRIRYSETDSDGRLTLPGLLNYFQDCTTFHSADIGLGIEYMKDIGQVWVLSAWQIVVDRYPELGENVTIGTLPYEFKKFMGYRNFVMIDEKGEYLAKANSLWTLISAQTGKPVLPDEKMLQGYAIEERIDMDYAGRKIDMPANGKAMEPFEVTLHMLDTNHHMNNGQYVLYAMSCVAEGKNIRQMRAEYKKQAFLGDRIYPRVAEQDDTVTVSLEDGEGKAYAVVEFLTKDVV